MLLKRLRDTMARGVSPEETLGEVVRLVANEMVAEVCSIYILRAGEVLELFATQGLNPTAVHRTRLRVGEGLVGDIAAHGRPLALDDAQSHPQFAYRPETGEEVYHSLAGVPILRAGRVLGVLAVQKRTRRQYDEEEIETLQTIAMVLAEMVAAGKTGVYLPDFTVDPEVAEIFAAPENPKELTAEQVRDQVLSALAQEARLMLDDGVVAAPEDLDLAMITGAGFSFWNGGLTMLLDRTKISEKVNGKPFH